MKNPFTSQTTLSPQWTRALLPLIPTTFLKHWLSSYGEKNLTTSFKSTTPGRTRSLATGNNPCLGGWQPFLSEGLISNPGFPAHEGTLSILSEGKQSCSKTALTPMRKMSWPGVLRFIFKRAAPWALRTPNREFRQLSLEETQWKSLKTLADRG